MTIEDKITRKQAENLESDICDMNATTDPLVIVERYFALKDIIEGYKEQGYDVFHYKVVYTKAYHHAWNNNIGLTE